MENMTYDELVSCLEDIKKQKDSYKNVISYLTELEYRIMLFLCRKYSCISEKEIIKGREQQIKSDICDLKGENTLEYKQEFIKKYRTILNFELQKRNKKEKVDGESFISESDANKYHIKELMEIVELISHSYPSSVHELAKEELNAQKEIQLTRKKKH